MLCYKGWLETRFRLLFTVGITAFILSIQHSVHYAASARGRQVAILTIFGFVIPAVMVAICAMLAGAGIDTQPTFQATKGLHGSTLFTLSLPVSRLRLLAVRSSIALLCGGIWLVTPLVRATATGTEMLKYSATVLVCSSAVYFFSVLLGTFLDDQWRIYGTMIAAGALEWLSSHAPLPAFADIFRAMGKGSPVIAHAMPWSAMGFSLGLSALLFVVALKIAQAREY
jgi:hypothetical protein